MPLRPFVALLPLALATACLRTLPHVPPTESAADPRGATHATVRATLDAFIADFNALDSARFAAHWAPTASAVLPFSDTPDRIDGREALLARFHAYFAQVRRERSGPPFLFMVLRDVRIEPLADDVALVAYAFDAGGRAQRRSLVMVRGADARWRIAHLHGSAASVP
jgi:ketosteroid isomerase-like protein